MIILDASVLIAHLESTDPNNRLALQLLRWSGAAALGASPLTLAEVLVRPIRAGYLRDVQGKLRELRMAEVPLGQHAAVRLAMLRAETNLKLPDCCVLLAAEDGSATAILTLDDRLRAQARRLGFDCPDVHPESMQP